MIVQTYFRFSYEEFEPMVALSRPILIGNIKRDPRQIVIRKEDTDLLLQRSGLICIASIRTSPPEQVTKVLRGVVPHLNEILEKGGLRAFGPTYESWALEIKSELEGFAEEMVSVLLWRLGIQGGPLRLSADVTSLRWSEDDESFDAMGFLSHQIPGGIFTLGLPDTQSLDIVFDRLPKPVRDASYGFPPLAQELLREAWRNIYAHPRSALVIGVAAAETGLKSLIVELVPENSWLIREIQSPPIDKLATKYLPTLPARCNLKGEVKSPPKCIMQPIRNGVESRNQIVHGRGKTPGSDDVRSLLLAIKNLLYLLDYYAGYDWALDLISDDVRKALEAAL